MKNIKKDGDKVTATIDNNKENKINKTVCWSISLPFALVLVYPIRYNKSTLKLYFSTI